MRFTRNRERPAPPPPPAPDYSAALAPLEAAGFEGATVERVGELFRVKATRGGHAYSAAKPALADCVAALLDA